MSLESRVMKDARDKPCIRCGKMDGTVCGRHFNGMRQHQFGKGRGVKCHPFLVSDFCNDCDAEFQEGSIPKSNIDRRIWYSEEFMFWCLMSLIRREKEGFFD